MSTAEFKIITLDEVKELRFQRKSEARRQYLLDPGLDASILVPDDVMALMVMAQSIARGVEVSGMGLVANKEIIWAAFGEKGTQGHVQNSAQKSAQMMAACYHATGCAPNLQIHTHPNMGCFWSGTDLDSQWRITDDAVDLSPEGEMYFIVYTAHDVGYGIKYALTRLYRWKDETFVFNDGRLIHRWMEFDHGTTPKQGNIQPPRALPVTVSKSSVSASLSKPQIQSTQLANTTTREQIMYVSESAKAAHAALRQKDRTTRHPLPDILSVIAQMDDYAPWDEDVSTDISRLEKLVDKSVSLSSLMDNIMGTMATTEEAAWLFLYVDTHREFSFACFWECFIALLMARQNMTERAKEYIAAQGIDRELCAFASDKDIVAIYPERKRYLQTRLAADLAIAVNNCDKPQLFDFLGDEANSYNAWFTYQVWQLTTKSKRDAVAKKPEILAESEKSKEFLHALDSGDAERIYESATECEVADVFYLESIKSSNHKLEVWFTTLKSGLVFGEVWVDVYHSNKIKSNRRLSDIEGTILDKNEFASLSNALIGGNNES